jgi:hypothetical protein
LKLVLSFFLLLFLLLFSWLPVIPIQNERDLILGPGAQLNTSSYEFARAKATPCPLVDGPQPDRTRCRLICQVRISGLQTPTVLNQQQKKSLSSYSNGAPILISPSPLLITSCFDAITLTTPATLFFFSHHPDSFETRTEELRIIMNTNRSFGTSHH